MTVSFKVVDNRSSISSKIKELSQSLDNYKEYFLQGMADEIILTSPVDTGTYITSHTLSNGTQGGFTSSFGKPKGRSFTEYAQKGLDALYGDISAIGDDWTSARFSNIALHASDVEYEHGYAVYTTARNKANLISKQAAERARAS